MENDLADNFETAEERALSAALKAPEAQEPMPSRLVAEMRRLLSDVRPASPCVGVRRWLRIAAALAILAAGADLAATIVASLGGARSAATDSTEDVGQAADGTQQAQTIAATPSSTSSNLPQSPSGVAGSPRRGAEGGATFSTQGENMNISKTTTRTAAIAAASLALATTAGLPTRAAASGETLYYRPGTSESFFPWDSVDWWFTGSGSDALKAGSLPDSSNDVKLYSSKNDISKGGQPMIVSSGVTAMTKKLTICDTGSGTRDRLIGVEIQDGGAMETSGEGLIGAVGKDGTGGGALRVLSGGTWTAKKNFFLAYTGGNSSLDIANGGTFSALKELIIGNGGNGVVTNAGTLLAYDFFVGGSNGVGRVVNRGNLTVTNKFTIGRMAGSTGYLVHESGTLSKTTTTETTPVYVGYRGPGVLEVHDIVSLPLNERIYLGGNEKGTGEGTLILCEGGSINNVTNIFIGSASNGARGHLQMAGGTLTIQTPWPNTHHALLVGKISDSTGEQRAWGDIRGHGTIARSMIARSTKIKLYGQVIADGGELDLSSIKTIGDADVDANVCGTNGWYAVNGGRLLYPSDQDFNATRHVAIGDYPTCGTASNARDITLVNSLQLRLDDENGNQMTDGNYNHAALYAADHSDIPGQVPGSTSQNDITLGVWRLGHFSAPGDDPSATAVRFNTAWLRFRIDSNAIPEDVDWSQSKVRLYRWGGSAWKVVGTAVEPDLPYVETTTRQPAYSGADADGWNIGWYAAALVRNGATTIVFR